MKYLEFCQDGSPFYVPSKSATVTLGDYIGLINSCGIEIIPPIYDMEKDSMIMKVIAYAPTRLACIKKMRVALEELFGLCNNKY